MLLAGVPILLLVGLAVAVVAGVHRAIRDVAEPGKAESVSGYSLRTIDPVLAHAQNPGFEPVVSNAAYSTGAMLAGDLYLGGPAGITILRPDGTKRLELRTGYELPVAPVAGMIAGRLRGASETQLLVVTSGAGLLILTPNGEAAPSIAQLLPKDNDAQDMTAVLALPTGEVLLGTRQNGALVYNGETLKPVRINLPGIRAATLQVTALAAVDAAAYLIGTRDCGVFYLHGGEVEQANSHSGLPDDQVESIAVLAGDGVKRAFVGTPNGTAEFDLAADSFRPRRTLAPGLFSHALSVDHGELAVGTMDEGVERVAVEGGGALRRVSISVGAPAATPGRIDGFLRVNHILYSLGDVGLLRSNGSGWTPALLPDSGGLTDRNISALQFAPDGTLYVGYFDRGLDLLRPDGTVRHLEDDHLFCINRLALDPARRTIAAATADGLVLFDSEGVPRQTLTRRDGLISDHVSDVVFNRPGMVVGTPAGITFLGAQGMESLYAFQGLGNNHVYALAAGAGPDELVAGTLGGISLLRDGTVERNLTVNNSTLKHNWITALLRMPDGGTLVGTYGAGLETMDGAEHFAQVKLPAGTPRDLVINPNAIFATKAHVFAGSLGHGMLVYSVGAERWSVVTHGLPSLNVTSFAERDGEVYVGTGNGLVRISEANLP